MASSRRDVLGQAFMALSLTATLALIHAHDQRVDTHAWVRHATDLRLPRGAARVGPHAVCQLPPWAARGANVSGTLTARGCEVVLRGKPHVAQDMRVLLIHTPWRWTDHPQHPPPDAPTQRVCIAHDHDTRQPARVGHLRERTCWIVSADGEALARGVYGRLTLRASPPARLQKIPRMRRGGTRPQKP